MIQANKEYFKYDFLMLIINFILDHKSLANTLFHKKVAQKDQ